MSPVLCQEGWFLAKVRETGWFGGFAIFSRTRAGRRAAPLLRRNLLMLLVQVAIRMASRTLAKNRFMSQMTAPSAGRLGRPRVGHTLVTFSRRSPVGMGAAL